MTALYIKEWHSGVYFRPKGSLILSVSAFMSLRADKNQVVGLGSTRLHVAGVPLDQ